MEEDKLKALLNKYQLNQCSEEEKRWIETWYNNISRNSKPDLPQKAIEADLQNIYDSLPPLKKSRFGNPLLLRIAASVFFIFSLSIGLYLYQNQVPNHDRQTQRSSNKSKGNLSQNGSYLTLDDNTRINLDNAAIGIIAEHKGIIIKKIKEGVIEYKKGDNGSKNIETPINIISTARGSQYQIILSDGTKVWLNALSSFKFPTSFAGKTREVEITGEGYFEVAKNKVQPFKVKTDHQLVEVLGTHFNINSYVDEPITETTLLEGSIKVIELKSKSSLLLKPGEQSIIEDHKITKINPVNASYAIHWKSGLFQFDNSNIQHVMRQLSRWYDVDFEFEGKIPDTKLWGEVHRNETAEKALEIISYFDLKYRTENVGQRKKIIISTTINQH